MGRGRGKNTGSGATPRARAATGTPVKIALRVPASAFPPYPAGTEQVELTEVPDIPGLEVQEDGSLHLTDGQTTWGLVRVTDDPPDTIAKAGRAFIFKAVTYGGMSRLDSIYAYVVRPDGLREFRRKEDSSGFKHHSVSGPAIVHPNGTAEWYHMGRLSREDGPAITRPDGSFEWWLRGKKHRKGGEPALVIGEHHRQWWVNGKQHRVDGPALEDANGLKEWWIDGKLHREDGPARENPESGRWEWFQNGKLHRVGGPAVETRQGHMEWWFEGALHNPEGPAIIDADGGEQWFLEGQELSERDWLRALGRSTRPKIPGAPRSISEAMNRR